MLSTSAIIGSKAKATAPATPTNVQMTELVGGEMRLSWTKSSGATNYRVQWNINGGAYTEVSVGDVASYDISPFWQENDEICGRVRAENSAGESNWSLLACQIATLQPF